MKDLIDTRFAQLEQEGQALASTIGRSSFGDGSDNYYVPESRTIEYTAWLSSAAGLLHTVSPPGSPYPEQVETLMAHKDMNIGVVTHAFKQVLGVFMAAHRDWRDGLLAQVEYMIAAATFDDFLDQADTYFKAKKKLESSVLGSAVLEDAVKKVAKKNGIDPSRTTLDPLIDRLVKAGVLSPVKAKRWKSFAGVRNKALHADWDAFDLDDVGALITGVREVVSDYL